MELEFVTLNVSPHVDVTAPTSPNRSSSIEFYYSAPASPSRKIWIPSKQKDDQNSDFDDFEFETSNKFSGCLEFEWSKKFEGSARSGCNQDDPIKERYHERGDSPPSMAFADELFLNGLVMPLKLPPRLQYDIDAQSISLRSLASTPRSPRTTFRFPFARQNAWDDDFDPFTVALKKVREEKKGNDHRRSRSHLLFMTSKSKCSSPRDRNNEDSPMCSPVQVSTPSYIMPRESKGSAYARWVRNQTKEVGRSPKGPKSPRGLFSGGRVRPVQTEREGSNEPIVTKGVHKENIVENKVQKVKGLLLRFASIGREKSNSKPTKQTSEPWTPKKFRQSSFRVEENGREVEKETMSADAKMAVAEYKMPMKPTLALCLGYGIVSPRNMK